MAGTMARGPSVSRLSLHRQLGRQELRPNGLLISSLDGRAYSSERDSGASIMLIATRSTTKIAEARELAAGGLCRSDDLSGIGGGVVGNAATHGRLLSAVRGVSAGTLLEHVLGDGQC